jgi:hypothetical protein
MPASARKCPCVLAAPVRARSQDSYGRRRRVPLGRAPKRIRQSLPARRPEALAGRALGTHRCEENLRDLTSLRLEKGGVVRVDTERGQERVLLRERIPDKS